jgi:PLP dependent protein
VTNHDGLAGRLSSVQKRLAEAAIAADRDPEEITIVAVSKTVGWDHVMEAHALGLRHFGENRVQDARAKIPNDRPEDMVIHLVGQLQTNKVAHALQFSDVVESVDRPSLISELEKRVENRSAPLPVLIQVNVAGESQKAGCEPDLARDLAREIQRVPNLRLDGLMTIAPLVDDPEHVRPVFRSLRSLRDLLQLELGTGLPVLSMGMTDDFAVAIQEGSTHVRVGRAIFGQG